MAVGCCIPMARRVGVSISGTTILLSETRENLYSAWADGTSSCLWAISPEPDGRSLINQDVQGEQAGTSNASNTGTYSISSEHPQTVTICLYDGSARTMSEDIYPQVLKAMITRNTLDNGAAADFLTAGN